MINTELRIGNSILYDFHEQSGGRKRITVCDKDLLNMSRESSTGLYNPILLTEYELYLMGFKKKEHHLVDAYVMVLSEVESPLNKDSIMFKEIALSFCNDKGNGEYYFFMKQGNRNDIYSDAIVTLSSNINYVHQLQNLYHALTETELKSVG